MTDTPLWRPRPVFLTSTFRDMQAERDHLRDHVFPVLEERLRERREYLEPIDLRQGVETLSEADTQVRELEVLKVCLEEVHRSRPFLTGLLGDRYGWIPPVARMTAAAEEAGYQGEVAGRSVTELEIAYGVLADPGQRQRSRFYLRRPLPYREMSAAKAADYSEANNPAPGAERAQVQLSALKTLIRTAVPDRWRDYDAAWDQQRERVTGLAAWGQQVLEDVWADLEADTRDAALIARTTWQGGERWVLEQFVETRARGFVGRAGLREELVEFAISPDIDNHSRCLSLTGEAGSGKSAVFSRLYRDLQLDHADVFVLAHAAGTSPRAARVDDILSRWVEELAIQVSLGNPLDEESDSEKIEQAFNQLLAAASTQQRVVVLIDALDQLESTARAQSLTWLRKHWPPGVRLITTAIPGTASEVLESRVGVRRTALGPLSVAEIGEVASRIYARYHRQINPEVKAALLDKTTPTGEPAGGNPLWLEMAVEALNLLDADDFERAERDFAQEPDPQRRIQLLALDMLGQMPGEVDALYGWVLGRAEKLHGASWARSFVDLIAVSRAGWREQDLAVLLPSLTGDSWDELRFAGLRRTFRTHIVQRGAQGQWDFAHQQLRRAVLSRHLTNPDEIRNIHRRLADHLEALPSEDPLHESETMVHLIGAGATTRLSRYYAGERSDAELEGASQALAAHIMESADTDEHAHLVWVLDLLESRDIDDDTRGNLCERYSFNLNDALANAPLALGRRLLETTGETLGRLVAKVPGNTEWQRELAVNHLKVGGALSAQGDVSAALPAYRAALEISQQLVAMDADNVTWRYDLGLCHERVGDVLRAQGDLAAAQSAYRARHAVAEGLVAWNTDNPLWQRDLAVSHNKLARVRRQQGDVTAALADYRDSLTIRGRLAVKEPGNTLWQSDLANGHANLGEMLQATGDLAAATTAYRVGHTIIEGLARQNPANTSWQYELGVSHGRLGDALGDGGDLPAALEAYHSWLEIAERLVGHDPGNADWQRNLSISCIKVGDALETQGDVSAAGAVYHKAHEILERLVGENPGNAEWQRDLSVSRTRVGDILRKQGDLSGALKVYRASHEIIESLAIQDPANAEWQHELAVGHVKLVEVLRATGELPAALVSCRAAHDIVEGLAIQDPSNAKWQFDLSIIHEKLGDVLNAQGKTSVGLVSYRESLEIRHRLVAQDPSNADWLRALSVAHTKEGTGLSQEGDESNALASFRASLEIRERLAASDPGNNEWQDDLASAHSTVGDTLKALGNLRDAVSAYRAAGEITESLAAKDPSNTRWQRALWGSNDGAGDVVSALGMFPAALQLYSNSLEIAEQLVTRDPDNIDWQRDLSVSYGKVGNVLSAQGELSAALDAHRASLEIAERLAAQNPDNAARQRDLVASLYNIALLANKQADTATANAVLDRCHANLTRMRNAGMYLDPALQQLFEFLDGVLREDGGPGQ